MATGGRVLHHLERMLPDPRNAVVLTGYQAVGTRGRQLAEGATRLKIHGQYDASDLVSWVGDLRPRPRLVFCTHGERSSAEALAARLEKELRVDAVAPRLDEVVTIDAGRLDTALPTVLPAPAASPNLTVAIDGRTYAAAHLEADLRRVAGAGDDLVLTGTITLRLTPRG
jgi:metallo-beta-lactamase family protein